MAKATPDTVGISPVCSDGGQTWSFVYTRQTLYEGATFLTWIVFLHENSNTIDKDLSQDTQGLTSRFATNDSCYIDMNHPIHFRSYDLAFIPISCEYVRNIVCVCWGRGECVHMCVLLHLPMYVCWEGQRSRATVPFNCSSSYCFESGSYTGPGPHYVS